MTFTSPRDQRAGDAALADALELQIARAQIKNALAHVPKGQHTMVAAAIRQAFLQPDADAAH